MKFLSQQNNREPSHFSGLHKGYRFKEFVKCSISAGHYYKSIGILGKQYLSNKKVFNTYPVIKIWIRFLLGGQHYVTTYRYATCLFSAPVGGFHYARPAACHYHKTQV